MLRTFKPNWDLYALSAAGLLFFYQAMQWPLLPKFVDIYYHLAVVKGFADAGGWVARDVWEFAPVGRPHLYPPFLHSLLLIPYQFGVHPIAIARATDVLAYPALLFSFWFFVRSREGSQAAFWVLLLFSSLYGPLLSSVTLTAFNLAMIGVFWTLYFFSRSQFVAAGLAAAMVCYTHTLAAAFLGGMLVMAAGFKTELRLTALKTAGLALALCLPLLLWQIFNAGAFNLKDVAENNRIEFDPFIYGLAAVRIARSFRSGKIDVWPVVFFLSMVPAIPFRQARVIGGYGLLAASWLAALEILSFARQLQSSPRGWVKKGVPAALILFFLFLAPVCFWNPQKGEWRVQMADRTLTRYLVPDESRDFRSKGFSIYFEKEYAEIAAVLESRTQPDEVFWTDFPHAGGILYLLTGRAMSTAMLGEVGPWEDRKARLENAKLLIWFKNSRGEAAAEVPALIQSMGLQPVAETSLAYIFENPLGGARSSRPAALIPTELLWALIALWALGLFVAAKRNI